MAGQGYQMKLPYRKPPLSRKGMDPNPLKATGNP